MQRRSEIPGDDAHDGDSDTLGQASYLNADDVCRRSPLSTRYKCRQHFHEVARSADFQQVRAYVPVCSLALCVFFFLFVSYNRWLVGAGWCWY